MVGETVAKLLVQVEHKVFNDKTKLVYRQRKVIDWLHQKSKWQWIMGMGSESVLFSHSRQRGSSMEKANILSPKIDPKAVLYQCKR